MIQGFYSAAVGAQQQMQRLNVQANNIANVNTYWYKGEKPAFEALMYGGEDGIDGARLPRGSGARMVSTATDFTAAAVEETGRDQDYAIIGEGFFGLYDPATGVVSFSRDGSIAPSQLHVQNEEGEWEDVYYLSDGMGRQVLDGAGVPIVMTDLAAEQPVGVFRFQYQDGLLHLDSGRVQMTEKNGALWTGTAQVRRGFLESSNVDLAAEIGKVIEAQRAYSFALKMAAAADEVETTVNSLPNG